MEAEVTPQTHGNPGNKLSIFLKCDRIHLFFLQEATCKKVDVLWREVLSQQYCLSLWYLSSSIPMNSNIHQNIAQNIKMPLLVSLVPTVYWIPQVLQPNSSTKLSFSHVKTKFFRPDSITMLFHKSVWCYFCTWYLWKLLEEVMFQDSHPV